MAAVSDNATSGLHHKMAVSDKAVGGVRTHGLIEVRHGRGLHMLVHPINRYQHARSPRSPHWVRSYRIHVRS
jgi:hypothetical protein